LAGKPGGHARAYRARGLVLLVVISHIRADHVLDLVPMSAELGRSRLKAEGPAL
jgi:hypothetical protein